MASEERRQPVDAPTPTSPKGPAVTENDQAQQLYPPAKSAEESFVLYLAWQFAHASGHDRQVYERMTPQQQRRFRRQGEVARDGVVDWIANNAPDAVAPLRRAGLLVWTPDDDFGDGPGTR